LYEKMWKATLSALRWKMDSVANSLKKIRPLAKTFGRTQYFLLVAGFTVSPKDSYLSMVRQK
jgi:hypothetical protein